MATQKFSGFPSLPLLTTDSTWVGLYNGLNYKFTVGSGIADSHGEQIIGWSSQGTDEDPATNYVEMVGTLTGVPAIIRSAGTDLNIGLLITTHGSGIVNIAPDDGAGFVTINDSEQISSISNDDTLAADSANILSTQAAVKGYVDAAVAAAVTPGLINQLAYYPATGSSIDGLAIVNSGTLTTDASGVPAWKALTAGQILVGVTSGAPVATAISSGQNILVSNGSGSISVAFTGTLPQANGGTGFSTYALGDTIYASAANTLSKLTGNITTAKQYLSQTGNGAVSAAPAWATIAGSDITGAALTKTDDTNVTLTLGGTPATSLLRAASLTLGWAGTLSVARGGTNSSTSLSNGLLMTSSGGAIVEIVGATSAGGQRITNLSNPSSASDAATKDYVDSAVTAAVIWQGNWDASTNTPTLTAGIGTQNYAYYVSVDGTQTLPSGTPTAYTAGDVVYYGANLIWNKVDRGLTVVSINGSSGILTLQGTTSQITVGTVGTTLTLSLPQNITTGSSPTFNTLTLSGLSASQVVVTDGSKLLTSLAYTNSNTVSTLVQRDGSGNFSAGTITAALTGNATTATTATNISSGGANQIPYQTGSGATSFITAGANGVLVTNGSNVPSISSTLPQNITLTTPKIATGLKDTNGNMSLGLPAAASSVNYISLENQPTGVYPRFLAAGSDADIGITSVVKGAGQYQVYSNAILFSNTGSTSGCFFDTTTAASYPTYTLPNQSGKLALVNNNAQPKFSAFMGANQSVPSGVQTKLQFNSENFDTNSNYDTTTYRFTPTVAGYYCIQAQASFNGASSGTTGLFLYKNGSEAFQTAFSAFTNSTGQLAMSPYIVSMNGSTDYLEMFAIQSTGSNIDIGGGSLQTLFSGFLIP